MEGWYAHSTEPDYMNIDRTIFQTEWITVKESAQGFHYWESHFPSAQLVK
jgi:hypothetical protein